MSSINKEHYIDIHKRYNHLIIIDNALSIEFKNKDDADKCVRLVERIFESFGVIYHVTDWRCDK